MAGDRPLHRVVLAAAARHVGDEVVLEPEGLLERAAIDDLARRPVRHARRDAAGDLLVEQPVGEEFGMIRSQEGGGVGPHRGAQSLLVGGGQIDPPHLHQEGQQQPPIDGIEPANQRRGRSGIPVGEWIEWLPVHVIPRGETSRTLHALQPPILDPMGLVRFRPQPVVPIRLVRLIVSLEPDDLGIAFERQHMRGDPVQEPTVV